MIEGGPKMHRVHEFRVFREILPFIKSGQKKYEVRVGRERSAQVSVGDSLDFGNDVVKPVTEIRHFTSPEECLATINPEEILPGHTVEDLLKMWNKKIDPNEDWKKFGIIVFKME